MKVKSTPGDFIVEELTDIVPGDAGEFAFYKLEKSGWTTPDALTAIRRRWDIDLRRLSYGGLKDRHAVTTQFFSIYRGPQRNLQHEQIVVTCLGRIHEPYSSHHIRANRFTITLRGLRETQSLVSAAKEIAAVGVPNYFDDQRFGSVTASGEFIALEMIRGNFEAALKLALAAPYEYDRAETKHEKATLRQHWGQWPECKARLPRGHARSLVDFLVHHPTDFKGAVARLRPELSGLYLSAYQSHVWNRMLAQFLRDATGRQGTDSAPIRSPLVLMPLKLGEYPAPAVLTEELKNWDSMPIPLPSARWKPEPENPWRAIAEKVLAEDGITLPTMRIPGLQKPYFSRGDRAAGLRPTNLDIETRRDEPYNKQMRATLRFDLNRGSYATMVIKRLTAATHERPVRALGGASGASE